MGHITLPPVQIDEVARALGLTYQPAPTQRKDTRPREFLNELITLPGHPYTKKNNGQVVSFTRKDGTSGMTKITTKSYQLWEHAASAAIGRMGYAKAIDYPINLQMRFYLSNNYKVDLSALYEGVQDILVSAGILADDNYKIVAAHDGSGAVLDRANPRTEVLITSRMKSPADEPELPLG